MSPVRSFIHSLAPSCLVTRLVTVPTTQSSVVMVLPSGPASQGRPAPLWGLCLRDIRDPARRPLPAPTPTCLPLSAGLPAFGLVPCSPPIPLALCAVSPEGSPHTRSPVIPALSGLPSRSHTALPGRAQPQLRPPILESLSSGLVSDPSVQAMPASRAWGTTRHLFFLFINNVFSSKNLFLR